MGYLVEHSKTTKIIPIADKGCLAPNLSTILPSGSWSGKRCFIICGGPSLEEFNFGLLQNELTVGINKSFTKFNSTVCFCLDQRMYDNVTYPNRKDPKNVSLHQKWQKYTGIKIFVKYKGKWAFDPSVYVVNDIRRQVLSMDLAEGIYPGNNSGFGALMLAVALGANPIYLLGCDMKIDHKKKKMHWHDGYSHQRFGSLEKTLPKFMKTFERFSSIIRKQGISVVNLNPDSALNCFPKEEISNIL